MKLKYCLLVMLCLVLKVSGQVTIVKEAGVVSGRIISEADSSAIPNVTVKLKKGKISTTNELGEFKISYGSINDIIQFSCIGYVPVELPVNKVPAVLVLKRYTRIIDEVIVQAYGTTTKRYNTGNITKITASEIINQPVTNPLAALEGRVPGVVISQTNGLAGAAINVQVRGQGSLDLTISQNNPLFVIDGVPFEPGSIPTNSINSAANNSVSISQGGLSALNTINPQDIESIEVLKDADATAIYGSRGANGVVLITTKKGKKGRAGFNANIYAGFSKVARSMKMLNTSQYVQMRKEAFTNDGIVAGNDPFDAGYAPDITIWDNTRYTDLRKLLTGGTAHTNDVQASYSGGNELTQFVIGGSYHKETTVYPGNFSDVVASFRFNINHNTADKRFNIQLSSFYTSDNNKLPKTDLSRYINLPPNLLLYDSTGKLAWQDKNVLYSGLGNGDIINPLSVLEEKYSSANTNLLSNLLLSYRLMKNITLKASGGYNVFRTAEKSTRPAAAIDPYTGELPSASFSTAVSTGWIVEPQIEYTRIKNNTKLNILLGNTLQSKAGSTSSQYGYNYSSDLLLNSIAAAGNITANNDEVQYRYTAFFSRLNYILGNRYIINLSARRDGSSRFGPDRQWANFGAVGAAWIFSDERFMKSLSFISYGKLRGSYGTTGNDQIGDYKFLNLWSNTPQPYSAVPGLYPRSLFNPTYNWEINKKLEAAIELGFLKDDILLSVSYYNNRCNNQLINYTLPSQTGFFSVVRNFPGLVQNSGIELMLTTKSIRFNKINWSASFNISIPKNKLISFPGLKTSSYANQYVEGQSLSVIKALNYIGVDPATGLYKMEDVDKDGFYTITDYQLLGNADPKLYGGLQNNINYKNFDLGFFFEFRKQKGLSYLEELANIPPGWIYNQPALVMNRWQKPGDIAPIQRFTAGYTDAYTSIAYLSRSNGQFTDASFIRLKNISLSYRIPAFWLKRMHITSCRLYVNAQNVLTITNYKGTDPETQHFYSLPPMKTIAGGIQFTF